MKVLLYIPPGGRSLPMPSYGLSVVAASIKDCADVVIIDRALESAVVGDGYSVPLDGPDSALAADAQTVAQSCFDLIAIQVHTGNLLASGMFLEKIRTLSPTTTIVVGGPSANIVFRPFSERKLSDFFVFGDASTSLRALLTERTYLPNVRNGDRREIRSAPYARPINDWPTPDFKYLYGKTFEVLPYLSSCGCVFNCSFCTGRRDAVGFRARPDPGNDVVQFITKQHPRLIRFNDSTFNGHRPTFKTILSALTDLGAYIKWGAYTALASFRLEDVSRMSASGCAYVYIGIESGDNQVRKEQNKRFINRKAIKIVRLLRESGIKVLVSIIVGLPGETKQSIAVTRDLVEELNPDAVHFFPYEDRPQVTEFSYEDGYWTSLLGRTTHRILAPQNKNGYLQWAQTLENVAALKKYFLARGLFIGEGQLVQSILADSNV